MATYIEDYLQAGYEGSIDIPKYVRKQYESLLPIIQGKDPRWYYNPALANKPIQFGEKFCRQSKGDWVGEPIRYLLWQKAAISAIYGIVERGSDKRRFQRIFILVGKKNGKTTMIAPIALYETAKKGNEVYAAANCYDQAEIIWRDAVNMLKQSRDLKQLLKPRQYDIQNIRKGGFSVFRPLANRPDMLDGKLPRVVILDEVHELSQDIYDILSDGQIGCSQPLLFMLTTNGYKRGALFDTELENSRDILNGTIQDDAKFSLLYELDDPSDWQNEEHWQQANPSLGILFPVDRLRAKVQEGLAKPSKLNSVKVKHFNIGGVSENAYFDYDRIDNERTYSMERFRYKTAIGGMDLSLTNDMTAFCTLIWDDENQEYCTEVMFWVSHDYNNKMLSNPKLTPTWRVWLEKGYIRVAGENTIDHTKLVDYIIEMINKYGLCYRWIYYDPWSAPYLIQALVAAGFKEGACLVKCYQGEKTLSVPFQKIEAELYAKHINYNNNPVVKWMLTNVSIREGNGNKNPLPEKPGKSSPRKIDGFMTMLDAFVGVCAHEQELKGA